MANRLDAAEVKAAAAGKWLEVFGAAGIRPEFLDGRHHPCPKCGGADRFRLIDSAAGAMLCSSCFDKKNGDGLAAISWWMNCSFPEAISHVANFLGLTESNGYDSLDPVELLARSKGVNRESLVAFGATASGRVVVVPAYDEEGTQCTQFFFFSPTDKGKFETDKDAGLFFPHADGKPRLPLPGESWLLAEGCKDPAALHGLGYLACGLNTCRLNPKFSRLFSGVDVIIVPDRDEAGEQGAISTHSALVRVARTIRKVTLPAAYSKTKGADVRDVLRKNNGEKLLRQAIRDAAPLDDEGQSRKVKVIERITAEDMEDVSTAIDFVVEDVLVDRQPMVIGGPSKSMKTSLMMDLAISVSSATPFLGRFPVTRSQRVAFISAESGLATLKETGIRVARAKGIRLRDLGDSLIFSTTMPLIDRPADMESVERFIKDDSIELVLFDPAYLMLGGIADRASNVFSMGAVLLPLADMCSRLGCTPIIAHHAKKPGRSGGRQEEGDLREPLDLEDLAYAGWSEFSRQWILVNRRKRYEDGSGRHELWMRLGGSAGHNGLWSVDIDEGTNDASTGREWNLTVAPGREVRVEEKAKKADEKKRKQVDEDESAMDRMVAALQSLPNGGSERDWQPLCAMGHARFKRLLVQLCKRRIVEPCKIEKRDRWNKPQTYDGYRLASDDEVAERDAQETMNFA